ncbi:MAG: EamA family transporter, partial [Proteobacteria bacterium]|nr:EamA family transporter [Pseudomonadota bacterium]
MLGGLLSLLSAVTFAFSNVAARRGVIRGSVLQALAITVPIGVPIFLIAALAAGVIGTITDFSPTALLFLALAGFFHFVWGRYCNYRAINAIGSNLASPVQQSSLIVSLGLAVWLLGESFSALRIFGIACIVIGPAIMLPRRRGEAARKSTPSPEFQPRYAEGYSFAILSSMGYGLSPIFIRSALIGTTPGTGLVGGLVSYTAATVIVGLILFWRQPRCDIFEVGAEPAKWFAVSGVFVCVSQMLRFMALAIAPVSVVTPIQRTTIVFRVLFGWFINR